MDKQSESETRSESHLSPEEVVDAYIERLFELHPDEELLARMWEVEPGIMSRLMPEIGNETAEEIEAETPKLRSYINFALNSLRISLGREPCWTPRQRMREARWQFENGADPTNS